MRIRLIQAVDDPEIKRGNGEVLEVEDVKANALIRAGIAIPHIETTTLEIPRTHYKGKGKIETPEG